jgi:hypothetical protein
MTEYNVSLRSLNTFGLDVTAKVLSRIGAMNDLQAGHIRELAEEMSPYSSLVAVVICCSPAMWMDWY